ncbi:hypothetical protein F2P45_26935 [Massilia sp. CCM 8733]|uniref:DUF11 domain-containing protein n=1 Tax=Massilia mucilaginosa TaxID=2609282 RepID=A0ABX0P0A9_9BURK|nr:DUF11 domain-containing protein [Massilia mucilaginosa]NHZ92617.1 hypothetical protein [Massilia mucilaginosa]
MTARPASPWPAALAGLCAAGLLLASLPARADTPISLFKSYAGRLNFTGVQKTMRTGSNSNNPCAINTGTLSATLAGIPSTAKIVSAQLYWAGSGSTPDYAVLMDGASVSAPTNRRFTTATIGYNYFSGAADVTVQVTAKRNATYTFGGLSIDNGNTFCGVQGVLGGFSLLAIYSVPAPAETFRVLNLYEGFQYIRTYGADNIKVNLNLSNFKTPSPLGTATGRIAHVTWEGDTTLSGGGENLKFNGAEMVDSANPSGNQFNSTSNIGATVDNASYGIDFDSYVLASPKLFAGQTTATMLYESGQDMVLLNAEIVSVPNVDVADLSLAIASSGTPARGSVMNLIHTVTNNGPLPDAGPVTVKHTLPTGLDFISAGGTGWTCSRSGQVLTCVSPEQLAVGEAAPALTISTRIALTAPGSMTANASVGGLQFDNDLANNSASKTISFSSARYVFTDSPCRTGITPGSTGQCNYLSMPTQQAAVNGTVYITAIDNTALDLNFKTIVPPGTAPTLQFSLKCVNPVSGAGGVARLKNIALKSCIGASAAQSAAQWQAMTIPFESNSATSLPVAFVYSDVGQVELLMAETASALAQVSTSGQFVVRPYKFALSTPLANPAGLVEQTKMTADIGRFWKAGAGFTFDVIAQNFDGLPTPNFGKEITPQQVELITTVAIDSLNYAVPGDPGSETLAFADMAVADGEEFPQVEGDFSPFSGGAASGINFTFAEAGIINVRAHMNNATYLDTADVTSNGIALGRFYPSYFQTEVPVVMPCPTPDTLDCKLLGLHYSKQPIQTVVRAFNAVGAITKFYQGKFVKSPRLLPFTTMGGGVQATRGTLTPSPIADAPTVFIQGVATTWPSYDYAATTYEPLEIYLRASDADLVTSNRSSLSVEGGTKIVRGRMLVENAFGSELLPLPVTARAQYWTGTSATNGRWVTSTTDQISILAPPIPGSGQVTLAHSVTTSELRLAYTQCKGNMTTCNGLTPFPDPKATLVTALMKDGVLKFKLAPTGKTGSVDASLNLPAWLPSSPGRLTFGVYKTTPLIYIREVF